MKKFLVAGLALALMTAPAFSQTKRHETEAPAVKKVSMADAAKPVPKAVLPCDPLNLVPGCSSIAGPVSLDIGSLWQKIIAVAGPDLLYAKAMADAAGTPGSKLRSTCLAAIIAVNAQISGTGLGPVPNPDAITQVEIAAEVIDSLQPTAPLISSCAAAANAVAMNVTQFLNLMMTAVAVVPK
jgi:hypothetical protein